MKRPEIIIAIDPDYYLSGVVQLQTETKQIDWQTLGFTDLIQYLYQIKTKYGTLRQTIEIVVEVSWHNTHNHHLGGKHTLATASKTGYNIALNHRTGQLIIEMAKFIGFSVTEQPPLRKCWKGSKGKITHDELSYFTGITGRTNQEVRDACLIAWNYANFPIRVKNFK
ncbi:MAG: hypothetical protein ACK5M3_05450 [Dysgonomonas sp.]